MVFLCSLLFVCVLLPFSPSEPSVMDRLLALEKRVMNGGDKDKPDDSRKEIQVSSPTPKLEFITLGVVLPCIKWL